MSLLAQILATKRREVAELRAVAAIEPTRVPMDVAGVLRRGKGAPLRLIAEVKLRSPSAGSLSRALRPGERAVAYAEAGASMVSVLSDSAFFDGSWEHVGEARLKLDQAGYRVPVLAKDYIVDERQIAEACIRGADAILLIARIVDFAELKRLARSARALGMEPLIEVVDEHELERALSAEARVIGVNARDLDTLAMDASRAARVRAAIPSDLVAVHLSGLREAGDVAEVARGRADAALVGEALMREDDPRPRLRAMVQAAS